MYWLDDLPKWLPVDEENVAKLCHSNGKQGHDDHKLQELLNQNNTPWYRNGIGSKEFPQNNCRWQKSNWSKKAGQQANDEMIS